MKITQGFRKMQIWWMVALALVIIIGWAVPWGPHKRIDLATVAEVRLVSEGSRQSLSSDEAAKVVGWFNEIKGVRNNRDHAGPGCGPATHLEITLTSGEEILIWGGDRVNRYSAGAAPGEYVDYYFAQPQLASYFQGLVAQAPKVGC